MKRRWISFIAAAFIAVAAAAPAVAQEDSFTVTLDEVDDSGYSGTAELTSDNDETTVSIDLEVPNDDDENGTLTAGIHDGTCDDIGDEAYELDDLENGSSESTVDASLDDLTAGEYVIAVHSDDELINGDAVACGEIMAVAAVADDDDAVEEDDDAVVDDEDDDAILDDDDDAVEEDDDAVVDDEDDDAILDDDDDAVVDDDEDVAVVDDDDAVADDEDPVAVADDVDPAVDDDTEEVAPATGSVPTGTEAAILMMTLLGAAALGVGFLVRRRAFQA